VGSVNLEKKSKHQTNTNNENPKKTTTTKVISQPRNKQVGKSITKIKEINEVRECTWKGGCKEGLVFY